MNVKGFIIEDDQGREFVMVCEKPYLQESRTFSLRGWQRRRLVPLHCSERDLRRIIKSVVVTLDDLFQNLPRLSDGVGTRCSSGEGAATPRLKKPLILRKVERDQRQVSKTK